MVEGAVGIAAPTWARDGLGSRRVDGEHVAATWRRPAIAVSGCQPAPEHEEDVGLRGRGAEFKAHDRRDLGQARWECLFLKPPSGRPRPAAMRDATASSGKAKGRALHSFPLVTRVDGRARHSFPLGIHFLIDSRTCPKASHRRRFVNPMRGAGPTLASGTRTKGMSAHEASSAWQPGCISLLFFSPIPLYGKALAGKEPIAFWHHKALAP